MDVSCKATRILFEAADAAGLTRARLVAGLDVDLEALENPRNTVSWTTVALVLDRLSELLGHDAERIRDFGGQMMSVPSYDFLRKLARNLVSPRSLCEAATRWWAPSLFPHLPLEMTFVSKRRVRIRGEIPERYSACRALFYIAEGSMREIPRLLDLPRAVLERSEATDRTWEATFLMPPSQSLFERVKRSLHGALRAHETIDLLERQSVELEQSFDSLRRGSEEVHKLLDRLPDLVVIHRNGTILWVNRVMVSALGYASATELVGTSLPLLVHESSRPMFFERMRLPAGGEGLPDLTEIRLQKPGGVLLTVEVAPAQNVIFGGETARLVVGRDVSDRVRIQQQLVTTDRLASLGLLAAGVAHEINNPLAYVLGNIETMGRTLPNAVRALQALDCEGSAEMSRHVDAALRTIEKVEAMQKTAREGCLQMRLIVSDLKTFSRADEDTRGLMDVRWSLNAATNIARTEIEKRARLITDYTDVPMVSANESRLGQVFLNLLVNAAQAIPEGDPASNEVRIATKVDPHGNVVVEISDTGPGISAAEVERVFDPFFTTKPVGVGTGLGLSICHGIVVGLSGAIEIVSTPGKGAMFRVTLPSHPLS